MYAPEMSVKCTFPGIKNLQNLLAKRDKEISKLQAELAIAYAEQKQSTSETSGIDRLQAAIEMKNEQLVSCQERISELESLQKFAQDTALKSDEELEMMRNQVVDAEDSRKLALDELEELQKAVGRLNMRISELSLAEQCAKAEAEDARYALLKFPFPIHNMFIPLKAQTWLT